MIDRGRGRAGFPPRRWRLWFRAATLVAVAVCASLACTLSSSGPHLDGATPRQLTPQGGLLLIRGARFARNARASVGSNSLSDVTWVNAQLLAAQVPGTVAPGTYDLTVSNPGAGSVTLAAAVQVGSGSATAAPAPAVAATQTATRTAVPVPVVTATPAVPAATSTAATAPVASRTATEPPTRQPTQSPTRPPAQAPTRQATQPATRTPIDAPSAGGAQPQPAAGAAVNLTGGWLITDVVTYGAGTGASYPFQVALVQAGNRLSGSGDGLSLSGMVSGRTVTVNYTQDNGSTGTFQWIVDPGNATFQGSFSNSTGNGGTSSGQLLGGGAVVTFAAPTAAPAAPGHGNGHAKAKGH